MLKTTAIALAAATLIGTVPVAAQTIDLGRNGPSIDLRSDRQRERDFQREENRRDRERDRRAERRYDRDASTGSVGRCREVTIRERDDFGRMRTRTREECR